MSISTKVNSDAKSLCVSSPSKDEIDHGIVRLHKDVLEELRISPGDLVLIENGDCETVVKSWMFLSNDRSSTEIVCDKYTRKSIDCDIGDDISLYNFSKDDVDAIKNITIKVTSSEEVNNIPTLAQRQLLNTPIKNGDVVPIPTNETYIKSTSNDYTVLEAHVENIECNNDVGVVQDVTRIDVKD